MNKYESIVKSLLDSKRLDHTKQVMKMGQILVDTYGGEEDQVYMSCLLHDVCKQMPVDEQKALLDKCKFTTSEIVRTKALWHAVSGYQFICENWPELDNEIAIAVLVHTTGAKNMSKTAMILYLSDYLEETRPYPHIQNWRDLIGKISFEQLFEGVVKERVQYELSVGHNITKDTKELYESII